MAKSRKLEEILATLNQIRDDPASEEAIATLRQTLKGRYSVAIAQVAKIVREATLFQLLPDLVAAFDRMMVKPVETDPGCLAKKEIAETLYHLEYSEENLFLHGVRHVQMEPVWGGKEDKATTLRGTCALGLVRMNYPQALVELGDLLADPEVEARIAAARAIAYTENPAGIPLLRLRVKVGDQPAVLIECLMALLKLAPTETLPLIKNFLYPHPELPGLVRDIETTEAAVLALGESHLPEAFDILKDWWQSIHEPELRRSGLLAIAMLRHEEALNFLLSVLAAGSIADARAAIAALNLYRQDSSLWQRVYQTIEDRGDRELLAKVREG
ncbi:HEAT repeat domain-containing protein [Kovacikia minuta CCNUW1]|uniref:HEAT repeat domain-containing protein n=1 Tax=Kovacikia minuta TaxID=2931930 RepID=UPI001CCD1F28|nr:HEAT repeat domain-containing protein [Kovacikia minuta]UBF23713.1 HEAT repeat domain-containing protein [Kovacikia minuta CCNUW1]